ncbi:MAG: hypothetical protein INQ03_05295 [Candidatus Heimdallarchaeota archaeon]|nr:hypothetical protein [Candidatus Heimdallarchaeota archaeon]
MPKRRFSLFGQGKTEGEKLRLLDIIGDKTHAPEKITDHSEIQVKENDFVSPLLKIDKIAPPSIPIIGIGGAGVRITNEIVKRLKKYNIEYNTLGLDINQSELDRAKHIKNKFLIPSNIQGTSKQYLRGRSIAIKNAMNISNNIGDYFSQLNTELNHDIVFVILGAGGTGVGVGLEIVEILKNLNKKTVPFLILPSNDENTRIKFNSAVALYHFSYAPRNRCDNLITICLDNQRFFDHNSDYSASSLVSAMNERYAAAIADLIVSTELNSDGYSADLNEFIEIFREIKGIGMIDFMHGKDISNIDAFYKENESLSSTLEADVYSGTRSYLFVQSAERQISSLEYRSLLNAFNNIDIFPKLNETGMENYVEIRGITTGIKIPDRIQTLMLYAEDVRVTLLDKELENATKGSGNPKIDRLEGDSDIEVMDSEELREIRAEEYAKKRRGGELT